MLTTQARATSIRDMDISVRMTTVQRQGVDPQLVEAHGWAAAVGESLQIRFAAGLYRPTSKNYPHWKDSSWLVSVDSAETGQLMRYAVDAFFQALGTGDVEGLTQLLGEFKVQRAQEVEK